VIERAVATCNGETLRAENLMLGPTHFAVPRSAPPLPSDARGMRSALRAFERNRILEALESTGGNQTRAAALLQMSRRTLTNKLNAYAIDRPRKRAGPAGLADAPAASPCAGPPPSTR
jgi:DNA-binding NtrC family response regulator